eukprot:CAMPEP_0197550474 /NCGR_PEP_ID=MMETSP1320-20131121/4053_1 /TAXON_ID=91990 /ORGANISM="Bolidomonas sp., Strain RCC2347" /LENGTH=216 /DNA_ID=CAMNT_0043110847 /DNA_START=106 /DNA_END=756 /DNA_ORIENTATION=+
MSEILGHDNASFTSLNLTPGELSPAKFLNPLLHGIGGHDGLNSPAQSLPVLHPALVAPPLRVDLQVYQPHELLELCIGANPYHHPSVCALKGLIRNNAFVGVAVPLLPLPPVQRAVAHIRKTSDARLSQAGVNPPVTILPSPRSTTFDSIPHAKFRPAMLSTRATPGFTPGATSPVQDVSPYSADAMMSYPGSLTSAPYPDTLAWIILGLTAAHEL